MKSNLTFSLNGKVIKTIALLALALAYAHLNSGGMSTLMIIYGFALLLGPCLAFYRNNWPLTAHEAKGNRIIEHTMNTIVGMGILESIKPSILGMLEVGLQPSECVVFYLTLTLWGGAMIGLAYGTLVNWILQKTWNALPEWGRYYCTKYHFGGKNPSKPEASLQEQLLMRYRVQFAAWSLFGLLALGVMYGILRYDIPLSVKQDRFWGTSYSTNTMLGGILPFFGFLYLAVTIGVCYFYKKEYTRMYAANRIWDLKNSKTETKKYIIAEAKKIEVLKNQGIATTDEEKYLNRLKEIHQNEDTGIVNFVEQRDAVNGCTINSFVKYLFNPKTAKFLESIGEM